MFKNEFLDSLLVDSEPYQQVKALRVFGTQFTREQLSNLLNINPDTIRRYESYWNTAEIPRWYFIMLRFLSGDLSAYGHQWQNCKIHPADKKLRTPHSKYEGFTPMSMNSHNSVVYQGQQAEIRKLTRLVEKLEKGLDALEKENALLDIQNQRLKSHNEHDDKVKEQIKKGNILEFKR